MATNENGCPHCGNKIGFAFGTCIECGYNYLEEKFKFITVHIDDLYDDQMFLVRKHAENTKKRHN